jgi:hypothetical protein
MEKRKDHLPKMFICQCAHQSHHIALYYDEECNIVEINYRLNQYNSFWKRLVKSIQYLFKMDVKLDYDNFLIGIDNVEDIKKYLDKIKKQDIK